MFFWLSTPELAYERVKARVKAGGHNIPKGVIERRYLSGIKNLLQLYITITDYWLLIDNSGNPFNVVAEGNSGQKKLNI